MEKYGLIATIGISTQYTTTGFFKGNNQPTLNVSEIQALADAGWEICSHTYSHENLRNASPSTVDFELSQSKADLESWGFTCNHFIYPYLQYSQYSISQTENYYTSSSVGGPPNHVWRPDEENIYGSVNPQLLPRVAMASGSTLQDFINQVTDAIACNTLPIIYFHALSTAFNNTGLSIAVTAGHYIELKWVTPTWSTNPTSVRYSCMMYVQT